MPPTQNSGMNKDDNVYVGHVIDLFIYFRVLTCTYA